MGGRKRRSEICAHRIGPSCLDRIIRIHERLGNGRRVNATLLAEELGISPRTIRRDLDLLKNTHGAPIVWEPSTRTYFYDGPCDLLPLLRLNADEALALELASHTFSAWQGSPLGRALTSAFGKIGSVAGGAVSVPVSDLTACISKPPDGTESEQRHFGFLLDAIRLRRETTLTYLKPRTRMPETRLVHPLHLAFLDHEWLLLAYDHSRQDVRSFLLARIQAAATTGKRFSPPDDFDACTYLAGSFGRFAGKERFDVRIRFDPFAAPYIRERTWHASQRLIESGDGAVELVLCISHLTDVQRWVLSWGSHAEALAPKELRTAIAGEILTQATRYKQTREGPPHPGQPVTG